MKKVEYSVKALLVGACIFGANSLAIAQNVGINASGATPDASAALDVSASDKGVLVPRVTLTGTNDATTITSPATSLLVYNTATVSDVTPGFYYYDGTLWVRMGAGTGSDDQNINGSGLSGTTLTIGIENGTNETVDLSSLQDGTGTDDQNISGSSLSGNTLTIGIEGGTSETVDLSSLKDHDWYEVGGTNAPDNINDTIFTMGRVGIGTNNPTSELHIQKSSGGAKATVDGTSFNGGFSLIHSIDDNFPSVRVENTTAGKSFDLNVRPTGNFVVIDNQNLGQTPFVLEPDAPTSSVHINSSGDVGIGNATPSAKLDVEGTFQLVDGTEGDGKVLTSDANGNASWETPSTSLLLSVTYPNGQAAVPNTTFAATGTHTLASFTAPSDGLYMICAITTATVNGGNVGDNASFSSNAQTYVVLSGGGSSAAEEHLSEDATKQISISYLFNLTAGDVVDFKVGQQNATSFGYSNLEMRVVKF